VTVPVVGTAAAAAAEQYVDLHMHSTASDGALAPEDVIAAARAAGLGVVALTDHDTVAGVPAARAAGERLGVRVITGVELSAMYGDEEIHLLGLHLERLDVIERELENFRGQRVTRAERMVTKLNSLGVPVTMDAVLDAAGGGAVGRPHVAKAVIGGGWARDNREAFDRYLGNGRPAYVGKPRLEVVDAVRMVHEAGGIIVYAHPGSLGRRERVEALARDGLDGLEVRHPSHSADDTTRLGALVDFFGMVPSGGSDWHGQAEGPRTIGGMRVPYDYLTRQEERVAAVRAAVPRAG
jgi:predicted metal-dependent phosphoesterase TrpH